MATPTPVFPASVATDANLMVANNLIKTTLQVAATATNTILFVASTAGFVPNCLVSVDNEIIFISSVVASPNPQLVVASGGRGFDGTTAAAHAAGAKVSMFIDAWHHNAVATEIKAIEAFMGPNGQNIGRGYPFLVSADFVFAPQSPAIPLAAGNNVITLSPVPKGINGTDQKHYLYVSGGTGTAEAVLITGGTAVGGAPSGTIIVNCANAHSGAWTIQSATGGIQEAVSYADPNNGTAILVPNSLTLRANVDSMGKNVLVEKFAGTAISGLLNYTIFGVGGALSGSSADDEVYTPGTVTFRGMSDISPIAYPNVDAAVRIFRSTDVTHSNNYEADCMWVQETYTAASGTPICIRSQLDCPNNTNSNGVASVAGYTNMGANSGTEGIGVHGQCDSSSPLTSAVGLNAEGSYVGASGTGTLFGVVSNLGTFNTGDANMIGVEVLMNKNPVSNSNVPGGGVNIHAKASTHGYGVHVYDDGGVFQKPLFIESVQTSVEAIVIADKEPSANAAYSIISFYRGAVEADHNIARILVSNQAGGYGNGIIQLATNAAGLPAPAVGLTVDQNQVVTVAKNVRTTPIPVAQLPAAAASVGSWACVNDSSVNTPGAVVAGGGGFTVAVFCSTAWKVVMA